MKKINWAKMGTTAMAVVVAVIVHRVVMRFLNMEDVTEQMFGAIGGCSRDGSPTFPSTSVACDKFDCCESNGGTVTYDSTGQGGIIGCLGGGSGWNSNCGGNSYVPNPTRPIRKARRSRFFK